MLNRGKKKKINNCSRLKKLNSMADINVPHGRELTGVISEQESGEYSSKESCKRLTHTRKPLLPQLFS